MITKIGFIGLGRMGLPMAYNLLRAGYDLTVHNRSQEKVREIADAGATAATSAAEVTATCEIVLACLPDVTTCETVFLGGDGVLANARPGQIIVDHSTVGAATSKACAAAAESRGAMFLDAPISGGTERAIDGTLTIMVGGPKAAYEKALPAFDIMGAVVRHVGPTGSGQLPSWSINCWWASTWLPPLKRCCWEQNRAPTRRWYSNWSTQAGDRALCWAATLPPC